MSTPGTSPPTDDSSGSLDEVIQVVHRGSTPEEGSDLSERAARGVFQSYTYITKGRLIDSSQDDSYSTASSKPSSNRTDTYPADYLVSSGTAWSTDVIPSLASKLGIDSGRSTVHPSGILDSSRRRVPLGKSTFDAEAPRPTITEISGWFVCNAGMSGFKALLWIFFPLLIFSLFAASRGLSTSAVTLNCSYSVDNRDPRCLKVCDSFTKDLTSWTSGSVGGGNHSGSSTVTILEILSNKSWQPAALITGMLGASVILQFVVFTITSPLLDYGNYQNILLRVGTGIGVVASTMPMVDLFRSAWWWIGAILFLLATVGLGLASTWLDQYLSSLSRGIPVLKTQVFDEVQIYQSERVRYMNRMSFAGITLGCLSSAVCTLAAFLFLRSDLVADTFGIDRNNWPLRIACCTGGLWWSFWNFISCTFLLRDRTGPSFQSIPYPAGQHLPSAILGLGLGSFGNRKGQSALLLLLVCFLSSLGNATVFQSGLLCFSPRNFITLALLAQVFSLVGTVLFFVIQIALSKSSKLMLLITLLVHLLLPIYACVGFFFTTSKRKSPVLALNREWEFIVFACAYGLCLGAHRSYIRTLLLACIPGTTLVGAYFSLLTLVNQLSTFVGTLEVLLFVYHNGDLRYTFVTMGCTLLLAAILMVKYITNHMPGDSDEVTDTESLDPASLVSESVYMSSDSSISDGSVPVYIPKSLRKQYSSKMLRQLPQQR